MKTFLAFVLFLCLLVMPGVAQQVATTQSLESTVYQAVTLLYEQDNSGGMHMLCTATAYRKITAGYRFATASHCVSGESEEEEQSIHFYITADPKGAKTFIPAKLLKAGNKDSGDDFSIFEVSTDVLFPVIPLGDDTKVAAGNAVVNVASPLGLGKQFFLGYVSCPKVDRPVLDAGAVKWADIMLVMIGSGPGSSGSAIVSKDQRAIVGFLVGGFDANIGAIVVPVSRFKAFEEKVDKGTYKRTPRFEFLRGLFGDK